MKVFRNLIIGSTLIFTLAVNKAEAANFTKDVNGWGYSEIRGFSLKPVLIPLGVAAIMITVAYLVNETSGSGNHHHAH